MLRRLREVDIVPGTGAAHYRSLGGFTLCGHTAARMVDRTTTDEEEVTCERCRHRLMEYAADEVSGALEARR